jgi:hypothetical protein
MVKPIPSFPARLALVVNGRFLPALPMRLTGQEASVRLERTARTSRGPVTLYVDWDLGGTTELRASLRGVDDDGRTAHLDVQGVAGDWRTFLAWLGSRSDR